MADQYTYRRDLNVPEFDDSAPIAVMDAECALCSWGALMIHKLDRSGTARICPVQSPLGTALLQHYGLRPNDPTSWLFLHLGEPHFDFEAVLHAGRYFGGWGLLVSVLKGLPKPLRNWLYRRVARNRYSLFGRRDMCVLPDPDFQKRLLQ
jgi:predicted DCC family thiol-disulfide oxidoreductase YuxK